MANETLSKLLSLVTRHAPVDGANAMPVKGLILARRSAPTDPIPIVVEPSLCVVAQGTKEVFVAGKAYRYDPAHSLLVSVDMPISARVAEATTHQPCLAVRILLDISVVCELLAEFPETNSGLGSSELGLEVRPVDPELLEAVTRLVGLLEAPHTIGALGPLIHREITYRLLIGAHGNSLRHIATVGAPVERIAMAVRWMRNNIADPLRIDLLAQQGRMSLSSFHHHFKAVTGLSPLQYQKTLRLEEARRLMLNEGLDAAESALRVGYESPSQFSREYRRVFGAPPRRDVIQQKIGIRPNR